MLTVIKYANRKLYVPKRGYITLFDLKAMLRNGTKFRVVFHPNGRVITNQVLRHVIGYLDTPQALPIANKALTKVIAPSTV